MPWICDVLSTYSLSVLTVSPVVHAILESCFLSDEVAILSPHMNVQPLLSEAKLLHK